MDKSEIRTRIETLEKSTSPPDEVIREYLDIVAEYIRIRKGYRVTVKPPQDTYNRLLLNRAIKVIYRWAGTP